jgi:hypothetical protein
MDSPEATGPGAPPFSVRDCAHTALSTGIHAESLKELREAMLRVPVGSIYQHFWGRLLQPRFDEPEYNNDIASWCFHSLHDKPLAERLSVIDPAQYPDLESLRQEVVEVMEQRLDEGGELAWERAAQPFYFVHSQIVVFDTGLELHSPLELAAVVPELSTGSIFYHFIDARRRTSGRSDDFSLWVSSFGESYAGAAAELRAIDPYFSSLKETRRVLAAICERHCGRGGSQ